MNSKKNLFVNYLFLTSSLTALYQNLLIFELLQKSEVFGQQMHLFS